MTTERPSRAKTPPPGVDAATGEIAGDGSETRSALEQAAIDNGATELDVTRTEWPMELAGMPTLRVGDYFPSPDAWAAYPQIDIDEIVGVDLALIDAMFFPSLTYDDGEWCIVQAMRYDTREVVTYSTGAAIVLRKLHGLKDMEMRDGRIGAFPINGKITKTDSKTRGHSAYYDLV